jgi:hypothetical protein
MNLLQSQFLVGRIYHIVNRVSIEVFHKDGKMQIYRIRQLLSSIHMRYRSRIDIISQILEVAANNDDGI